MPGKINDALTDMKKDETLNEIHKKWLGTDAPAGSSTVTEAPMPQGLIGPAPQISVPATRRTICLDVPQRTRPGTAMTLLNTFFNLSVLISAIPALMRGLVNTLLLGLRRIGIGIPVGPLVSLVRLYGPKPLRLLAVGYIDIFRTMPASARRCARSWPRTECSSQDGAEARPLARQRG